MARPGRVAAGLCAIGLLATGCGSDPSPDPEQAELTVMTRNLYLGADVTNLFGATDLTDLARRATTTWQQVQASDIEGRVDTVAAEIIEAEADVVGLQEVSLWRTDDRANGPLSPATDVAIDVLDLLMDALEERAPEGTRYEVGPVAELFDGEVPTTLGFDVRLTDRDVTVFRVADDAPAVTSAGSGRYDNILRVEAVPGLTVSVARGWTAVDVSNPDAPVVRVYNTHLEAVDGPEQVAQGEELRELADDAPGPVVVLGDINSRADPPHDTSTYGDFVAAGYVDAWAQVRDEPGSTCCQAPDLRNEESELSERIDVVFSRSLDTTAAARTGATEDDRTASGLWPSDHAGVVATLLVPSA